MSDKTFTNCSFVSSLISAEATTPAQPLGWVAQVDSGVIAYNVVNIGRTLTDANTG